MFLYEPEKMILSKQTTKIKNFIGKKIISIERLCPYKLEELMSFLDIKAKDVFSSEVGVVSINFNSNENLCLGEQPSLHSIIVCTDVTLEEEEEYKREGCYVDSLDLKYSTPFWKKIINQTITTISIVVQEPENSLFAELPNEVALKFTMDNGVIFYAGLGLNDYRGGDLVIISSNQIDPLLLDKLHIKELE